MTRKKEYGIKGLLGYLPIITISVGLITAFVKMSMSADEAKTKIAELKTDVKEIAASSDKKFEELKDKTKDTDKKVEINKTQQDNIQAQVQQISEKSDKIYDILIELKQKKK